MMNRQIKPLLFVLLLAATTLSSLAQGTVRWTRDGNGYFTTKDGELVQIALPAASSTTILSKADLTPAGQTNPLKVDHFVFSEDQQKVLIFTNTVRVWRLNSKGDYWVIDLPTKKLKRLGNGRPASSLMFAKFSPDGSRVAYVSEQNLYLETLATGEVKALTAGHGRKLFNGTFDWVYEEELSCRDGFQWSPDGQHISYWQVDANKIRDYYMINTTDSAYSRIVPVEYPTIGQPPSPTRIGILSIATGETTWLKIPGDPQQNYLPRLEWHSANEVLVQQLNRKQNESRIYACDIHTGDAKEIYREQDTAWIELFSFVGSSRDVDFRHPFVWLNSKKEFLWMSEKDGWTNLYRIGVDGKEKLITTGNFDVIDFLAADEKTNTIYFMASPDNATQSYLYKTRLDGKGKPERITPAGLNGRHGYDVSPTGQYAIHTFSNSFTRPLMEWVQMKDHKALKPEESIQARLSKAQVEKKVEFFQVTTIDGVTLDGWMVKPNNFDPSKKYPVVFEVYTEPASQTVVDRWGIGMNRMFDGNMAEEGYIYMSLDGRGTPGPKGRAWRKSIYRQIGRINIRDQAMGAKEVLKMPFVDKDRIAVWGWSGGGSTTLNLLFQYPDIYQTGIAIAAVANQLTYDNIYQERYMGLPQENLQDILDGSPVTHAKNLKGNLLYIHGTGDDNVHYNNAEMLVNELIKHNKQFQLMAYPNRSHGIFEGEGTRKHLSTLYTEYLRKHCPGGGR